MHAAMGEMGEVDGGEEGKRGKRQADAGTDFDADARFVAAATLRRARQRPRGKLLLAAVALLSVALGPLALLYNGQGNMSAEGPGARQELSVRGMRSSRATGSRAAGAAGSETAAEPIQAEGAGALRSDRATGPRLMKVGGVGSSILVQGPVQGKPIPASGWLADNAKGGGWRAELRRDKVRAEREKAAESATVREITGVVRDATAVQHHEAASRKSEIENDVSARSGLVTTRASAQVSHEALRGSTIAAAGSSQQGRGESEREGAPAGAAWLHGKHAASQAGEVSPRAAAADRMSPLARALVNHVGKDASKAVKVADDVARTKTLIPSKLTKELTHVISQIVRQATAHVNQRDAEPRKPEAAHGVMKSEAPADAAPDGASEQEPQEADGRQAAEDAAQPPRGASAAPAPDDVDVVGSASKALNAAGDIMSKGEKGNLDAGLINATAQVRSAVGSYGGSEQGEQGEGRGWLAYKRIPLTYVAWLCAAVCVVMTMLMSAKLILRHLDYYADPDTQKYVVRILFMAPIYAVDSLLALTFVGWATTYIDVFRDCYEAFTIYNFLKLLIVLLGGERAVIEMLGKRPQVPLIFPLHWLDPWEMGAELFYSCKYGALQYVLVKPTCALVMFVSGAAGIYGPNSFSLARLHFYVFFFSNISQMWALYCLLMFYVALKEELAPYNPVLKFVIVKAVVFFCFWQGMLLGMLAFLGYIRGTADFDSSQIVEAIQELLVCVEMVIVAFLFHKAFPVEEFVDVAGIEKDRSQDPHKRERFRQIRQNAADPFRIQDIRDDMSVYGTLQEEKFYGAVQATQDGLSSVIQSARLSATTPRAPDPKVDSKGSSPTSKGAASGRGEAWPDPKE